MLSSLLSPIHIDEKIETFLKYNNSSYGQIKEQEFEIRFSESGNNSISLNLYNRLLGKCVKNYSIKVPLDYKTSVVEIYNMTTVTPYGKQHLVFRKIKTDGKVYCQMKDGKEQCDKSYFGKDQTKYTIRYSSSREKPIECPVSKDAKIEQTLERRRNRFEYDTGRGYTYMFTKVKESNPSDKVVVCKTTGCKNTAEFNITDNTTARVCNLHKEPDMINVTIKYEFEIEYVISQLSPELIIESLWLVTSLFRSNVSIDIIQHLNRDYFSFYDKTIYPPKPINISEEAYGDLKSYNYTVTNKLDGERVWLFFLNGCIYARQNSDIIYITKCAQELTGTLIDAEFFKGKFYFFDCPLYKKKEIWGDLLENRLLIADTVAQTNSDLFVMKKFYNNLLEGTTELFETMAKSDNDGLIYTPNNHLTVYKWKFPEKMSIDFRVVRREKEKGEKYDLCVYTKTDKKGVTPFKKGKEEDGGEIGYTSGMPLEDGKIYEFMYDKTTQKFVLNRQRTDKVLPNFVDVASNVFKDMIHPFESYKLLEMLRPMHKFRKYHNFIKRCMINTFCKGGNKTVLDLGIGRGGDIDKYKYNKVQKIFGVEPNETNYKQLLERFPQYMIDPAFVELIKTTAQDTPTIVKAVGVEGVDIVASFFSLSFFFFPDKPDDLTHLVQTISQNLKEGGYFIGTTIDGGKVKDLLSSQPKYDFKDGTIELTSDNKVVFEIKGTIVERQLESLVDFERLKNALESVGITYVESSFFKDNEDLLQVEKPLNALYRTFVFKKHKLTQEVNRQCHTDKLSDLLTRTEDNRCVDLFYKMFEKKVDMFAVSSDHTYDALKEFILIKKYINPIESPHLIKTVAITGDRLSKVVFRQKIPVTAVTLAVYKNKQNYPILRDQIVRTLQDLQEAKIDYGNLTPELLLVNEESDGNIQILFYDYSNTTRGENKTTDRENLPALLEFLTVQY